MNERTPTSILSRTPNEGSPTSILSRTRNESSRKPSPLHGETRRPLHRGGARLPLRGPADAAEPAPVLPHHELLAYGVARELLLAVLAASVRDAKLRDEAVRSAKSACLNCAEGAGRVTRADKARAFAIARAEAVEAAAAVEIAALCGDATAAATREVARVADRLVSMLTPLVRWRG